jgi:spore maturation protein B
MSFSVYVIPVFLAVIIIAGYVKKVDIFSEFIKGAKENLQVSVDILPTLIALMLSIGMLRASGLLDLVQTVISPVINTLGFPAECVPLALIRPLSGSGALAVYEDILTQNGADSFAGRVASVLLGSTETTFYTITVYYGVTNIRKLRHTVPCAVAGDLTGFILSALMVRLLMYN